MSSTGIFQARVSLGNTVNIYIDKILNSCSYKTCSKPFCSSMYFDEDGELAHEFYEEVLPKKKGGARKMRRVNSRNLVPQVSS